MQYFLIIFQTAGVGLRWTKILLGRVRLVKRSVRIV